MSETKNYEVLIIGAGPAGLSAGLYASRNNLKTLMIDKQLAGGQLHETETIDNYVGSISRNAQDLADAMVDHATSFGAELLEFTSVNQIIKQGDFYHVTTDTDTYVAPAIIVATGTLHNKLDHLTNLTTFESNGVSYCATCDAAFFDGETVVVVGGGDTAFESALLLSQFTKDVIIVSRSKERAKPFLVDQVNQNAAITIVYDTIAELKGDTNLEQVVLTNGTVINAKGLFSCIGAKPELSHLSSLNLQGVVEDFYINPTADFNEGLFFAGDIQRKGHKQVAIAVGDGAQAALEAYDYLVKKGLIT